MRMTFWRQNSPLEHNCILFYRQNIKRYELKYILLGFDRPRKPYIQEYTTICVKNTIPFSCSWTKNKRLCSLGLVICGGMYGYWGGSKFGRHQFPIMSSTCHSCLTPSRRPRVCNMSHKKGRNRQYFFFASLHSSDYCCT